MDYINGETLAESMASLELNRIEDFIQKITQNISEYRFPNENANIIFKRKIDALEKQLILNINLKEAFRIIKEFS